MRILNLIKLAVNLFKVPINNFGVNMKLLNNMMNKILKKSNSYNFYKKNYSLLYNKEKKYISKINALESELSTLESELLNKNQEIKLLNNFMDNKNKELHSQYDSIINKLDFLSLNDIVIKDKLDVLSEDNDKINNGLSDIDNKYSDYMSDVFNDNGIIKDKLDVLSEDNDKINKYLENLCVVSRNLLKFCEDSVIINDKLNNFLDSSTKRYIEQRKYFFNGYEELIKSYVDTDFLFNICYFNDIEFLSFSPEENRILLKTNDGIIFSTNNHFWTMMEIYGLNEYSIPQLYSFDDFVVLDVGMNRAYATLNFANYKNCSAVFGFEIDKSTYDIAIENINLNPKLKSKITPFNIGLSDCDDFVDLYYIDGIDGLNTMIPEFANVQPHLILNHDVLKIKSVKVKKASSILGDIINKLSLDSKIILKIDTEGAEYKIINDLISSNLISKIDVILGEGHIFSDEDFRDRLKNLNFEIVKMDKSDLAYSFAFVKKEYFKYWEII